MTTRKIQLPDRTIEGTEIPFTITRDAFLQLELEDGALLSLKPVIMAVLRTEEKTPDGDRVYIVMSANQLTVVKPAKGDAQ
jgi:hypothetical protein